MKDEDTVLSDLIIASLFSDARATSEEFEEVRDWEPSRKGYWGDQLDGILIGSKLWLLKRSPKNEETLQKAMMYARESLTWIIDKGFASNIDIETKYSNNDLLILIEVDQKKYEVTINDR